MTTSLTTTATMTERDFGLVFGKLAIQLQWRDADEVSIRSYYEVLKDLPLEAIQASAAAFAKERGRKYFPPAPEWHEKASAVALEQLKAKLQPEPQRAWTVECTKCDDTGWDRYECTGDAYCGRTKPHRPHDFVKPCPCRATNRTYQRHQQFGGGA